MGTSWLSRAQFTVSEVNLAAKLAEKPTNGTVVFTDIGLTSVASCLDLDARIANIWPNRGLTCTLTSKQLTKTAMFTPWILSNHRIFSILPMDQSFFFVTLYTILWVNF